MTFTLTTASVAVLIAAGSLLLGIIALILNRLWKLKDEEKERRAKETMRLVQIEMFVSQAKDERGSIAAALDRNTEILVGMSRWRFCPHDTARTSLGNSIDRPLPEPLPEPPWERKK